MTAPERLRAIRLSAGLTQAALARMINDDLGLAYGGESVGNIEHGRKTPSAAVIGAWCTITRHPEYAAAICAYYGNIHPETARALRDPDFATLVHKLAKEHTATH